jgi:hypothetical protein
MAFIMIPLGKRIKQKLAKTKRLARAKAEHRAWLKSQGLDNIKKDKNFGHDIPDYIPNKQMPKTSDRIVKVSGRAEPQHYSGERKLLGIGMLHKSNLVPVFDQQDAIDISKMRRN